ncbi:MAG: hypothetical protein JWQ43_1314 [Glaciihabitans sp.]|nr:hypothetical protein [Glaciihabitans sp.]
MDLPDLPSSHTVRADVPTDPAPPRHERWLVGVTEYAGVTEYTGGIGRHYAALLPALAKHGVSVDLLVFSDRPALSRRHLAGVRLIGYVNTRLIPPTLVFGFRALLVRLAYLRRPYDRVFLPEWDALGAALPRRAPLLTNLATSMRLATEVAGYPASSLPLGRRLLVAMQNRFEDRQIQRSAGLIPISRAMREWTQHTLPVLQPVRVVRNCIDVEHVVAASLSAPLPSGWPHGDGPVVLFLGRLERRKGVVDAMQAFAEVTQQIPSARLVLAGASGDGRFEPTIPQLLALLPEDRHNRVTFLGHVAGDELYRAIWRSSVVLCPSRWEGFGNVALETQAIRTPLICTEGSGFDDFCVNEKNALMVPPQSPAALADAIRRILTDPALGQKLTRAAAKSVRHFAPAAVAADLLLAADEILGATSGAGDRAGSNNEASV